MTKEEWVMEDLEVEKEVENLAKVVDKLFATTADNRDTMYEIAPTPPLGVSIAITMTMLLKNVLFYKETTNGQSECSADWC